MARAIPDQPSRTATRSRSCRGSIGDRTGELCCRGGEQRDECSTGKVAYGEDHSRPDGAHSRLLKTAGADPAQAVNPIECVTKSASSVTNSVTSGITQATGPPPRRTWRPFWTSARPSMARVIPDQPSRIPGPVPRLARTRPGRTSRWIGCAASSGCIAYRHMPECRRIGGSE